MKSIGPLIRVKICLALGALLILLGLFTAILGPAYTTEYVTKTSTSYTTFTTITACMSAPGVTLTCSTSDDLVYLGTIRYSTSTTTTRIVTTAQTASYTRNYIGTLIAVVGASMGVVGVLLAMKRSPKQTEPPQSMN